MKYSVNIDAVAAVQTWKTGEVKTHFKHAEFKR